MQFYFVSARLVNQLLQIPPLNHTLLILYPCFWWLNVWVHDISPSIGWSSYVIKSSTLISYIISSQVHDSRTVIGPITSSAYEWHALSFWSQIRRFSYSAFLAWYHDIGIYRHVAKSGWSGFISYDPLPQSILPSNVLNNLNQYKKC